jgi:peptidoglycan biosynthesis protein MviN/MurJ (putative lipid II flippase)
LFFNIFSKFETEKLYQYKELLYAGSVIIFFQLINSFLTSVLTSYKYFSIAIFTSLLNSILCILLTVTLHKQLGINGTMIGLAAGYLLNFLLLVLVLKVKLNWDFFHVKKMRNKIVWQNIGLMQINILPLWLRNYIGLYLLSGLPGVVTSLNLGQQLSAVPELLLTSQLLTVAGIKFNELNGTKKAEEANEVFLKTIFMGITITLSMAVFFILFSKSIVTLGYLKTITSEKSLLETTLVFSVLAISLPVKLIAGISTSMLTSFQKIKSIISVSATVHVVVTILMIVLIKKMGLLGYLIGINVHYFLFLFLFYPLFRRTLTFVNYKMVLIHFAKDLLLNGLCATTMFFLLMSTINGIDNLILRLLTGFVSYLVLYFLFNHFLKLNSQADIKGIFNYVNNTIFQRKTAEGN